jgi:hypothetical protein
VEATMPKVPWRVGRVVNMRSEHLTVSVGHCMARVSRGTA